jgi:hypothetical protein
LSLGLLASVWFGLRAEAQPSRSDRLGISFISSVDIPHEPERYERALALGASWNRFPMYWDRIETQAGRFEWAAYDDLIAADMRYDLRDVVVLFGIPEQWRAGSGIAGLHEPIFADGTDAPAPNKPINPANPWARFVRLAAERYMPGGALANERGWRRGEGIRVWEIWNEPDHVPYWGSGAVNYARLLKAAYLAIKTVDPQALVMVGGLLYPTQNNFLAQVLNIFINDPSAQANNWYMDAVGIHSYGDVWRCGWLTLFARQTMIAFGFERPIWITEMGVPVWDDYPGPTWLTRDQQLRGGLASQQQQANFIIQSAAYAWSEGAEVIFWHQLYDDCGNQPPGTNFPPHDGALCVVNPICFGEAFGIFRNPASSLCFTQHPTPDSPRPVARAFRLLADTLGRGALSRRGVVNDTRQDGLVTIEFTRPETGERLVVMWNTRSTLQTIALPAQTHSARLYTLDGEQTIQPSAGVYRVDLPPASMPRQRFLPDDQRARLDIGGAPAILIEQPNAAPVSFAINTPMG